MSSIQSLIIVTGLSGAGKSTALSTLEDNGYYCIDNLPFSLFDSFLKKEIRRKRKKSRLAIDMDARDASFFKQFEKYLPELKKRVPQLKIIFLTASETALLQRFSQTRRRHPLAEKGQLLSAIRREKKISQKLKSLADEVIDTTHLTVHSFRAALENLLKFPRGLRKLPISFISFGHSYGIPPQCDMVFDVRFLPNPYFVPSLKALNGTQTKIQDFVLRRPETRGFIAKTASLLNFLLPRYAREGKSYLTVGFGCTGGRHRSVAIAHFFKDYFAKKGLWVSVEHRDLHRGWKKLGQKMGKGCSLGLVSAKMRRK